MEFNSFTFRATHLFHRMLLKIRDNKPLALLFATADIITFKIQLTKYLSCVRYQYLISGSPHCGQNSLLERNAEPGSAWRMLQQHSNVDGKSTFNPLEEWVRWPLRCEPLYSDKIPSIQVS